MFVKANQIINSFILNFNNFILQFINTIMNCIFVLYLTFNFFQNLVIWSVMLCN